MRMEDLDPPREEPGAQAAILQALDSMSDAIGDASDQTDRFAGHLEAFTEEAVRPLTPEASSVPRTT